MNSPLIKKTSFRDLHEDLVIKTQTLRTKNDQYQRLSAETLDSAMMQEIRNEKVRIDQEIKLMKEIIDEMEMKFKEPHYKNKLKQSRKEYEKQVGRYKSIMESIMERSFINASSIFVSEGPHSEKGGQHSRRNNAINNSQNTSAPKRGSMKMRQQQMEDDYQFERNLLLERNKGLSETDQHLQRINAITNDMALEVDQQGRNIDIIGEEMMKAQENVQAANSHLEQAAASERKSRKKYVILFVIVLILIGLGAGAFFIFS